MATKKHASDSIVAAGDLTKRVGIEQIRMRGVEVEPRPVLWEVRAVS
jgi:hypothetical protein